MGANPRTDVSVRAAMSDAGFRALVESLRGASERRVCPDFAVDLSERARGRSQIAVSYLNIARARRAKVRRSEPRARLSVHDRPSGKEKYTDSEIQQGRRRRFAHKRIGAPGYNFPIKDPEDVSHAVRAWGRARPSERESVKKFITPPCDRTAGDEQAAAVVGADQSARSPGGHPRRIPPAARAVRATPTSPGGEADGGHAEQRRRVRRLALR